MAVERRRSGFQPFGQQAHVQAVDAELVDEIGGDGDDVLEAPGRPPPPTFRRRPRPRAPPGRASGGRTGVYATTYGLGHRVIVSPGPRHELDSASYSDTV